MLTPAKPTRWSGTPSTTDIIRPVNPPELVVIDLGALYGRPPHLRRPNLTVLAELSVRVVGYLDAWICAESGWYGACRYQVCSATLRMMTMASLMVMSVVVWKSPDGLAGGALGGHAGAVMVILS